MSRAVYQPGEASALGPEFSGRANAAFGLGGLLPGDAVYRFELELADEGGAYKVTRATWEPGPASP